MKKTFIFIGIAFSVVILALAVFYFMQRTDSGATVTSFDECVAAGNPVMESYPRQCRSGNQTFVEDIGNALEKADLIRLNSPLPNDKITSPLRITGEARGYWYFEATFPVTLADWDGRIIAQTYATANGEWMTEEFVPFDVTVEFENPVFEGADENHFSRRGALILQKSNPSGLPENDDALEFTVWFE